MQTPLSPLRRHFNRKPSHCEATVTHTMLQFINYFKMVSSQPETLITVQTNPTSGEQTIRPDIALLMAWNET